MKETDIIIIGGGAAGLMCARDLSNAGINVTILEARERMGGRMHTITDNLFPLPVELGAEFIHGNLPLTKQLLKEGQIEIYKIKGDLWRFENGRFAGQEDFIEDTDLVIEQLKKLPTDLSVAKFLNLYFSDEKYGRLRKTLKNYVEGYDAADLKQASAFAILQELLGEEDVQYRIKGGYQKLVDHLVTECTHAGCIFESQTVVKEIRWKKGRVDVIDQARHSSKAEKVVITVPLGVLQSPPESTGHIIFSPAINEIQEASKTLGYGYVIKIVLHFNRPLWNVAGNTPQNKKSQPSFLFSDAIIPTWWTQMPEKNGMITGWIAGPKARRMQNEPGNKMLNLALESLAVIFQIPRTLLESELRGSHVFNWAQDDFSRGAYSYETVNSRNAKRIITNGVENTLYFAGEAYYDGPEAATVEAALVSGKTTAKMILENTAG